MNTFFKEHKQSLLIHGIPGIGKSTFASEFSRYFCSKNENKHFCVSFTINTLDHETVNKINESIKILSQPVDLTNKYLFVFDNVIFEKVKEGEKDKIIFDELFKDNKYDGLTKNLPSNVYILLTSDSCNPKLIKMFNFYIKMDFLNKDEARKLLTLALKRENESIEPIMNKFKDKNEFVPQKLMNVISFIEDQEDKTINEAMDSIQHEHYDSSNILFRKFLEEENTKQILELIAFSHSKKLKDDFFKKIIALEHNSLINGIRKLKNQSILYQAYDSTDDKYYLNIHDVLKDDLLTILAKDKERMKNNLDKFLKKIKET